MNIGSSSDEDLTPRPNSPEQITIRPQEGQFLPDLDTIDNYLTNHAFSFITHQAPLFIASAFPSQIAAPQKAVMITYDEADFQKVLIAGTKQKCGLILIRPKNRHIEKAIAIQKRLTESGSPADQLLVVAVHTTYETATIGIPALIAELMRPSVY